MVTVMKNGLKISKARKNVDRLTELQLSFILKVILSHHALEDHTLEYIQDKSKNVYQLQICG